MGEDAEGLRYTHDWELSQREMYKRHRDYSRRFEVGYYDFD